MNILDISGGGWGDVSHGGRVVPASWCPRSWQKATKSASEEEKTNCEEDNTGLSERERERETLEVREQYKRESVWKYNLAEWKTEIEFYRHLYLVTIFYNFSLSSLFSFDYNIILCTYFPFCEHWKGRNAETCLMYICNHYSVIMLFWYLIVGDSSKILYECGLNLER